MKKFIIITSIFNPTKAGKEFSKLKGYNLIVVGDKKTPHNWSFNNVTYLSLEDQLSLDLELPSILPYNHYCRKMVGYLHAINNNAEIIIDTDDDNIPYKDWSFPELEGSFNFISNFSFSFNANTISDSKYSLCFSICKTDFLISASFIFTFL